MLSVLFQATKRSLMVTFTVLLVFIVTQGEKNNRIVIDRQSCSWSYFIIDTRLILCVSVFLDSEKKDHSKPNRCI